MKYLITSGCSFTSAHRVNLERADDNFLIDDQRTWYYPHWLQQKFPEVKVFNMGSPANNNSMIVRSAIYKAKELLNNGIEGKDISMIIQWSSFFRRTHFISNEIKEHIPLAEHRNYANDYLKEKSEPGANGYWINLAVPNMGKSSLETGENKRMFKYNTAYVETLYNDESRYFEWLEYFDYLIQFCEKNEIEMKSFFMHNSFSLQYDYGLMPYNWKDADEMIDRLFTQKEVINTWNEPNNRADVYPYCKYLYNSIDWDKYCWFFEEDNIHSKGGVFEWTIRNQVKSTDEDFNPIWMEYTDFKTQTNVETALRNNEMGPTGHVSSCNYKKFTEDVILKWDMFHNMSPTNDSEYLTYNTNLI
jgi:hypothetical protein